MPSSRKALDDRQHRGYRIGITFAPNADGSYPVFGNGLRQNVIFLYRLFKASRNCARVFLVYEGPNGPVSMPDRAGIDSADVTRLDGVASELDYLISVGSAVSESQLRQLRASHVKLIAYKGGNGAVISMEGIVAHPNSSRAELHYDAGLYDEVWLTPQHVNTARGWYETIYRCPVRVVPQVWSPLFLDAAIADEGRRNSFGYRPGRRPCRIGVMDPNVTVMKTSHMPMLVIEAAYRVNPGAIGAAYITGTYHLKENRHFSSFANKLSSVRNGVMTFEERFVSYEFMMNHCDAIVTHQWENALNYLYYEALFGAYPLIHNSEPLKSVGYYYQDFNAADGARVLLEALEGHDRQLDDYKRRASEFLSGLDPANAEMISLHESLLNTGER